MEIRLYIRMLVRGWWIIALTTLVAVNVALLASFFTTPMYQADARFVVSPRPELLGGDIVDSLATLDKRSIVSTYAEFLNSRRIYLDALQVLQLQEESMTDYVIETVVLPEANILVLSVSGPDPQLVALLANTMGQQAINYISLIYRAYDISFLDPAIVPQGPYSPQPIRDTGLALALGLVGGMALAVLSEQIRIPLESYRQRLRVDSLTGVNNSRHFRSLLERNLLERPEEILSIGIIELYGLQDILDTLPQPVVHNILRMVTDVLRRELRGNDVVGRWTDTSFIVMLPATVGSAARRIFERIFMALSQPISMEQYDITVNLDPKVGGAVYSNGITYQELLDQAGNALEQSRRSNAGFISIWEMKNPFWVQAQS
ncbi:MAG: diguanylate cyclase [Chloroflexi bacterium]|nr:diguanylate cyclase [Chloroflexota bacterium]